MKIILSLSIVAILISNCGKKNDSEKEINVKFNSIDNETKQLRVNMYDTVIIRKQTAGYLMKNYKKIGQYITDSTGSVTVKIDPSKIFDISVTGVNVLGGEIYYPGQLKEGQDVNIEVKSLSN